MNGLFANFSFSSDIQQGSFAKVLEIKSEKDTYYRLINQVMVVNPVDITLPSDFSDEVADYLTDIIESNKFDISVTNQAIIDVGIISCELRITFKNGIQNNLDAVSTFFRNINTLKKRIFLIKGYQLDIIDLNKNGAVLKIYK
jgi:hypothetical protein